MPTTLTNQELAVKLDNYLTGQLTFVQQLRNWLAGSATGGPNNDGQFPLSDGLITQLVSSPAKMAQSFTGVRALGTKPNTGALPATGNQVGDVWVISGDGYVWNGTAWVNAGPFQGANVELQNNGTSIQWRIAGTGGAWTDLYTLASVKGDPGATAGPATSVVGYVPLWANVSGSLLGAGRAIGQASSSDILDRAAGDARYLAGGSTAGIDARLTTAENKLAGIQNGATANSTDAQLRDRSTHTGSQAISTVTSLQTTLDAKLALAGGTMTGPIVLAADASANMHPVTYQQFNAALQGLSPKATVRAATTANITLSGTQTIDTVAVVAGDRVLVKNQTSSQNNGIYVVSAGSWTRATDADLWSEIRGAFVFVQEGGQTKTGWVATAASGGTLGTTAITWNLFTSVSAYTASNGVALSGVDFRLAVDTLTEDTAPVAANDFLLTYDASASAHKKVKLSNLPISTAMQSALDAKLGSTATAAKASTLAQNGGAGAAMTFLWSGQSGQPTWLWGSNDGSSHYVYNPSNFSVSYAVTAGNVAHTGVVGASGEGLLYFGNANCWIRQTSNSQQLEYWAASGTNFFHHNVNCNDVYVRSDRRLKSDIKDAPDFGSILDQIEVKTFVKAGVAKVGVIAQELEEILPNSVVTAKGDYEGIVDPKSIATDDILFMLLKEVQSLRARVAELEAAR